MPLTDEVAKNVAQTLLVVMQFIASAPEDIRNNPAYYRSVLCYLLGNLSCWKNIAYPLFLCNVNWSEDDLKAILDQLNVCCDTTNCCPPFALAMPVGGPLGGPLAGPSVGAAQAPGSAAATSAPYWPGMNVKLPQFPNISTT